MARSSRKGWLEQSCSSWATSKASDARRELQANEGTEESNLNWRMGKAHSSHWLKTAGQERGEDSSRKSENRIPRTLGREQPEATGAQCLPRTVGMFPGVKRPLGAKGA